MKQEKYTKSADIYSAGVVLCLMTTGHLPFPDVRNIPVLIQKMEQCKPDYSDLLMSLVDLLEKMMKM